MLHLSLVSVEIDAIKQQPQTEFVNSDGLLIPETFRTFSIRKCWSRCQAVTQTGRPSWDFGRVQIPNLDMISKNSNSNNLSTFLETDVFVFSIFLGDWIEKTDSFVGKIIAFFPNWAGVPLSADTLFSKTLSFLCRVPHVFLMHGNC